MNFVHITQQNHLESFCQTLSSNKPKIVSVDTEFIRKTTYWPRLCLIQLAFHEQIVLIDPLPNSLDLSPLRALFFDEDILKIFHAARQDLEVFYMLWQEVPQQIADTQILAMVCGFGDSISYDKLSEALTGKKVDKSQQHTDWSQRPLSEKQIQYAMGDVEYLESIYEKLVKQAGIKIDYITEELALLKSPSTYKPDPEKAWLKIKLNGNLKPQVIGVLKEIATVRERYACEYNKPRSHVIKDETLLQLASKTNISQNDLKTFGIQGSDLQRSILDAIQRAVPFKPSDSKPKHTNVLLDILNILLKIRSDQYGVASKLIATREKLDTFLENPQESPLTQGWRLDLFGNTALKIKKGEIGLVFDPITKKIIFKNL